MSQINWAQTLGWDHTEIHDLRFVGYAYIKQGMYDVALTFFDALIVLYPPTVYDLQTIGALHLQLGNALKALESLDRALKMDPSHIPTQLNRAKTLLSLGSTQQAIAQARAIERQKNKDLAAQATALILSAEIQSLQIQ
jgi:tetratricopeptide (TPR) repeat protein